MRGALALAVLLAGIVAAHAQLYVNGVLQTMSPAAFVQIGPGPARDGASAGGAEVSLLGSGQGAPSISCPAVGATWRIAGGGVFSTFATPGNITPKVAFGSGAVSSTITNALASASNARWDGEVKLTCITLGASGTIRATGKVTYSTGSLIDGSASLNNGGAVITLDNTGPLAVDIRVLMATANAANVFRLDLLTIERLL